MSKAAARSALLDAVARVRPNVRLIGLLALGPLVIDLNQGALPAVPPFVNSAHGLSYAQIGTLVLMANVTRPVTGFVAARFLPVPRDRETVAA